MAEGALDTATFMIVDVENIAGLPEATTADAPPQLGSLVAEAVRKHGGRLVELSDGRRVALFAEGGAIAAAIEIQRGTGLAPRIAIHRGSADLEGPAASRCGRILDVARGGQILVSETAAALAPPGVELRNLGHHRLRDLLRPERLFAVVAEGVREDATPPDSLNGSIIPLQVTTFVGRADEIRAIGARLRHGLLTLLGPGGVGKTRLAYQAAAEAARGYEGGATVVELADVPSDPATALATTLGLRTFAQDPVERALMGLRGRDLLLVLDNCDHLLDEVVPLVEAILAECEGVAILATSRHALGATGEETAEVLPLTLPPESPDSPARVLDSEAGRLFVQRAGSRLTLDEGNMGAVAAICRRLDGLPLAIELAAARCDALTPQEILDRLSARFELIARHVEEAPDRRRTMQEAIEWSKGLLSPAERTLLARMTAFRGGWTLESVESALRTSWDHLEDPFDVLRSLVDKSLAFTEDMVGETVRYRLLETVREYVRGAMDAAETDAAAAGLFAWAADFGVRASDGMEGGDQRRWFEQTDLEWENLRLALVYGLARPPSRARALRLAVGLHRYWVVRGHYALGRALLEPALEDGEGLPDDLRAKATNLVGVLALCQGDLDAAARRMSESLVAARATDDISAQGVTLCNLGMIAWERMEFPNARDAFQEAASILETVGEPAKLGVALLNLGCVLIDMDRLDEARLALSACLEPLRKGESLGGLAFADGNLGYLAIVRGDRDAALRHVRESLSAFGKVGDWKGTMNTLVSAATLLALADDLPKAATIRGTIEKMGATAGAAPTPRDRQRIEAIDLAIAGSPDPQALRDLRLRGLQMSPQHGVEYALAALTAVAPVEETG